MAIAPNARHSFTMEFDCRSCYLGKPHHDQRCDTRHAQLQAFAKITPVPRCGTCAAAVAPLDASAAEHDSVCAAGVPRPLADEAALAATANAAADAVDVATLVPPGRPPLPPSLERVTVSVATLTRVAEINAERQAHLAHWLTDGGVHQALALPAFDGPLEPELALPPSGFKPPPPPATSLLLPKARPVVPTASKWRGTPPPPLPTGPPPPSADEPTPHRTGPPAKVRPPGVGPTPTKPPPLVPKQVLPPADES